MEGQLLLKGREITVQPVGEEQMEALLRVYRQCEDFLALEPSSHATEEMVKKDLEESRSAGGVYCGIYTADQELIGIVDFIPSGWQNRADTAYMELLMIVRGRRSRGIGAEVQEMVEKYVRDEFNVVQMMADVQVNNPQAVRFWERVGYAISSVAVLQKDQTLTYEMHKSLVPAGEAVIESFNMKFSYVRLLVSNFMECFLFYRDVLGLQPTYGEEEGNYAEFQTGEVTIALFSQNRMAEELGSATPVEERRGPDQAMLNFAVDNVDAVYALLRKKGVQFVAPPIDHADWGVRTAHFRDPGGFLIEIHQHLSV